MGTRPVTRTPRQVATETSPSKRSTCVLACHGDVGLGDTRPQTGWRKGQTLISRGPGGWTCRTGSSEHHLPGSRQAPGPSWCSPGRDAALLIPLSPVTGAIMAPPHARPPTLVACRKPWLTRPPPGTTLPRVRSGGTRAESGHHPGRAPGTYERSAASSCAGRGRSGHRVLVRELSETERLCPGQPPWVAVSVIKTTNP